LGEIKFEVVFTYSVDPIDIHQQLKGECVELRCHHENLLITRTTFREKSSSGFVKGAMANSQDKKTSPGLLIFLATVTGVEINDSNSLGLRMHSMSDTMKLACESGEKRLAEENNEVEYVLR
jgi:hypothetical protein